MNSLLPIPVARNDKRLYMLSLFYAREKWAKLISTINIFFQERQSLFSNCLISFSEEKGENLQVCFISPLNDNNNYTNETQSFFESFFEENPSINTTKFPYGESLWGFYPNNSLVWNRFSLYSFSDNYIQFHQITIDAVLSLLEDDLSEDSVFSLVIYLITKELSRIEKDEQKNSLFKALNASKIKFSKIAYTAKELVEKINIEEVSEVIESYWHETEDNCTPEVKLWTKETDIFLKNSDFNEFCNIICKITGLSGLRQLIILDLINNWYNKQFY